MVGAADDLVAAAAGRAQVGEGGAGADVDDRGREVLAAGAVRAVRRDAAVALQPRGVAAEVDGAAVGDGLRLRAVEHGRAGDIHDAAGPLRGEAAEVARSEGQRAHAQRGRAGQVAVDEQLPDAAQIAHEDGAGTRVLDGGAVAATWHTQQRPAASVIPDARHRLARCSPPPRPVPAAGPVPAQCRRASSRGVMVRFLIFMVGSISAMTAKSVAATGSRLGSGVTVPSALAGVAARLGKAWHLRGLPTP